MSDASYPKSQKPATGPNLTQRRKPSLKAALRENLMRRKQVAGLEIARETESEPMSDPEIEASSEPQADLSKN